MSDKATQVVVKAYGRVMKSGESIPAGASVVSYLAGDDGKPIDSPTGNRTWHYNLASGRLVWGAEDSDALDTSTTRPDATAKTMSVNLQNVKPGDRLFIRVEGVGSRGERLNDLPGNNAYFDLVPAVDAQPVPIDPIAALENRLGKRIDDGFARIEEAIKSLGGTVN